MQRLLLILKMEPWLKYNAKWENIVSILIVDDEILIAEYFKTLVQNMTDSEVMITYSGKDAVEIAKTEKPALIFMDISMENKTAGIDSCNKIKELFPDIRIYLVSAYNEENFKNELNDCKHAGYIDKTTFSKYVGNIIKLSNDKK